MYTKYDGTLYEGVTMDVNKVRELVWERIPKGKSNEELKEEVELITEEIVDHLTIDSWDYDEDGRSRPWNEQEIVNAVFSAMNRYGWTARDFTQHDDDTLIWDELIWDEP